MLNATNLKTELISALDGINNATDAHNAFSTALFDYIKDNAEITGAYVGTVGGNPDPFNGAYAWKIASADDIIGQIETLSDWETNIQTALATIALVSMEQTQTITIAEQPTITIGTLDVDMSSLPDTQDSAIQIVASNIINAITNTIFTTTPSATSTGGGGGIVTFSGII